MLTLAGRYDAGDPLPVHETYRINENAWRACRYGVRGWLVDHETGEPRPTRELLADLIDEVVPASRLLDSSEQLEHARTLLAGNGADRQRYVAARDGLVGLGHWLMHETQAA